MHVKLITQCFNILRIQRQNFERFSVHFIAGSDEQRGFFHIKIHDLMITPTTVRKGIREYRRKSSSVKSHDRYQN